MEISIYPEQASMMSRPLKLISTVHTLHAFLTCWKSFFDSLIDANGRFCFSLSVFIS